MKVHLENWSISINGRYRSITGATTTQESNLIDLDNLFGYDGVLVCESVVSKEHAELIRIAPNMLRLLLMIEKRSNEGYLVDYYFANQIAERAGELLNEFRTHITPEMKFFPLPTIKAE